MIEFLDLRAQYQSIKSEIDDAFANVIEASAFVGGSFVHTFEQDFARYMEAQFCIGVGNGTDALEIAIEALDLPQGCEIIVPGNSFIASAEAVTRCGHRVVFSDVDPECYTLGADHVRAKLTKKTAAIMPVHLYGHPCDMELRNARRRARPEGFLRTALRPTGLSSMVDELARSGTSGLSVFILERILAPMEMPEPS